MVGWMWFIEWLILMLMWVGDIYFLMVFGDCMVSDVDFLCFELFYKFVVVKWFCFVFVVDEFLKFDLYNILGDIVVFVCLCVIDEELF